MCIRDRPGETYRKVSGDCVEEVTHASRPHFKQTEVMKCRLYVDSYIKFVYFYESPGESSPVNCGVRLSDESMKPLNKLGNCPSKSQTQASRIFSQT